MDQGPRRTSPRPAAWWSGSLHTFVATEEAALLRQLSHASLRHFRTNEPAQLRAWSREFEILRDVVAQLPEVLAWRLLLEFQIPRLGGRIDAVLLAPTAVFVLEFKTGATHFAEPDRRQLLDYALDLQDFHAGTRGHPIVPILVATDAVAPTQTLPFSFHGVGPEVLHADATSLPALLRRLAARPSTTSRPIELERWEHAAYDPVPNIIDAACLLFARHAVAEIVSARADTTNLTRTAERIANLIALAQAEQRPAILFVTGIPGAGKTLCGLNAAFGIEARTGSAFLTGNPTLVHVLREALVRDAVKQGQARRDAAHRMKGVIQALPRFRDDLVASGRAPPERVIIIDEAQRCWTASQAIAKTRDRPVQLDRAEPAHLLDIMSRHAGLPACCA